MILGKFKKHRAILLSWYKERFKEFPSKQIISCLEWFAKKDNLKDYGYTGDWREHLDYCADRMNGGRASAILRLLEESKRSFYEE
jgi:hypothetical protein